MEDTVFTQAAPAAVREAVADAQALAREQVSAAWQLLDSGWRQQLDEIFVQRFGEVHERLEQRFTETVGAAARQQVEQGLQGARETAFRQLTERLNQTARRMKQAESREVWIQAFLERAADFCGRAALFAIQGKSVHYEGGLGVENGSGDGLSEFPLESAPAFGNAVEARDTVVAMATARELSETVTRVFGESPEKRAYLFPFAYRGKVVGVLYAEADGPTVDVNGLELLTALAETTIETGEPERASSDGLIRILPPDEKSAPPLEWSVLPRPDQEIHARAERFARNRVAQIMLYKIHQVRTGRETRDLYSSLKEDIDAGRDSFREQFLQSNASVPDYFHTELVRTLAKGDPAILGPAYPGALD
jgi:hypothetical protein